MYEDLQALAQLKFGKELEASSARTRQKIQDEKRRFAATAGPILRSGQHDMALGEIYIGGAEQMVRITFQIWVDLINQRNGHIARQDINFIADKVEQFANIQQSNLLKVFSAQRLTVVPSLVQQTNMRMYAAVANIRRDLEIMVREQESFPKQEKDMKAPRNRFSPGRRVLVGLGNKLGTVQSVAEAPSVMGEYVHEVILDGHPDISQKVLGCDMRGVPVLDADLQGRGSTTIHIQHSNVANLNLGSQVGTITTNLQSLSEGGEEHREFAEALEKLTNAVISDSVLKEEEKQEVVEAIATITEETAKKPEARSKVSLKALVTWIPTAISSVNGLVTLWDKVGPIIRGYLGF